MEDTEDQVDVNGSPPEKPRANFHAAIILRLEKHFGQPLVKRSRSQWATSDDSVLVACHALLLTQIGFNMFSTNDKFLGNTSTQQFQAPRFSPLQQQNGQISNTTVNFADLLSLAQNYARTPAIWVQGDLNYDGSVNFSDLLLLAQNYGRSASGAAAASLIQKVAKTKSRPRR